MDESQTWLSLASKENEAGKGTVHLLREEVEKEQPLLLFFFFF